MKLLCSGIGLLAAGMLFGAACSAVRPDTKILAGLRDVAVHCVPDLKVGRMVECRDGKGHDFRELALERMRTARGRVRLLAALAEGLHDKDANINVASALLLDELFLDFDDFMQGSNYVSDNLALRLISGLARCTGPEARFAVVAATHSAALADELPALFRVVDAHGRMDVRLRAYRHFMKFARVAGLPRLKKLMSSDEPRIRRAASFSLRSLFDLGFTERGPLCDFALPLLNDRDAEVAANAAAFLGPRCAGTYIDAVLTAAETRARAGALQGPFARALRGATFSCKEFLGLEPQGTRRQCQRLQALLKTLPPVRPHVPRKRPRGW